MQKVFVFGALLLANIGLLFCEEFAQFKKNSNHIYFGPEIFALDFRTHFKHVKVHGAKFFWGFNLGYEYLKAKAFYFGIDFTTAAANHGFHESYKVFSTPQSKELTGFGHFELRFGYTFAPQRWVTTPFLCLGGYGFGSGNHHHHFEENFGYIGGGVHSQYAVSPVFYIGVNAKIFASDYRDEKFRFIGIKETFHHGLWGGEVGVPCIWRIGSHRRWDVRLEPYLLKLNFAERENAYGTRLLFGYSF